MPAVCASGPPGPSPRWGISSSSRDRGVALAVRRVRRRPARRPQPRVGQPLAVTLRGVGRRGSRGAEAVGEEGRDVPELGRFVVGAEVEPLRRGVHGQQVHDRRGGVGAVDAVRPAVRVVDPALADLVEQPRAAAAVQPGQPQHAPVRDALRGRPPRRRRASGPVRRSGPGESSRPRAPGGRGCRARRSTRRGRPARAARAARRAPAPSRRRTSSGRTPRSAAARSARRRRGEGVRRTGPGPRASGRPSDRRAARAPARRCAAGRARRGRGRPGAGRPRRRGRRRRRGGRPGSQAHRTAGPEGCARAGRRGTVVP